MTTSLITTSMTARRSAVLEWVSTAARLGLAAVFLTAGLLKAVDPQSSAAAMRANGLLLAGSLVWRPVSGWSVHRRWG